MSDPTINILFPGTEVPILDAQCDVRVCPLGLSHMKKFSGDLTRFITLATALKIPAGTQGLDVGKQVMSQLSPLIIENLIDLVLACCVFPDGVSGEVLPHYDIPPIVDAWIQESFGEPKKWKPWVTLIESTVTRATGEMFSLSETLSPSSSEPATVEPTS